MAQAVRQPFNAKGDFVAGAKGIRYHGKSYPPGAKFPWRKLSCSERKLRQLHERRLVEFADDFNPDKAHQVEEPVAPVEEPKVVEDKTEDEASGEVFVFDPTNHMVHSPKRHKFVIIDSDGKELLEIDRELAKELKDADEPVEIELEEE